MKKISRVLVIVVSSAFIANLFLALIIHINNPSSRHFTLHRPKRILVFAAHQDDCVIQAGGLAIQNVKLGGEVNIAYLTRTADPQLALTRKNESYRAWRLLDPQKVKLLFLDYYSKKPWSDLEKISAKGSISSTVEKIRPDLVVIPLKEGGHYEHDLLNSLVLEVMTRFPDIEVLQAAEYNPYFIIEKNPAKMLWFLVRLLPYVPYKDPNYGLIPEHQIHLQMSDEDLDKKIKMLSVFESQKDVIPLAQFGYPDLFDSTSRPPANLWRVFGKYFSTWSIITLFVTFLLFWSLGFASFFYLSRFIIITIPVSLTIFAFVIQRKEIFDELIYIIVFIAGILSGKIIRTFQK